jgi:hypothetical protein
VPGADRGLRAVRHDGEVPGGEVERHARGRLEPVDADVRESRRARFMATQAAISERRLASKVGRTIDAIVDAHDALPLEEPARVDGDRDVARSWSASRRRPRGQISNLEGSKPSCSTGSSGLDAQGHEVFAHAGGDREDPADGARSRRAIRAAAGRRGRGGSRGRRPGGRSGRARARTRPRARGRARRRTRVRRSSRRCGRSSAPAGARARTGARAARGRSSRRREPTGPRAAGRPGRRSSPTGPSRAAERARAGAARRGASSARRRARRPPRTARPGATARSLGMRAFATSERRELQRLGSSASSPRIEPVQETPLVLDLPRTGAGRRRGSAACSSHAAPRRALRLLGMLPSGRTSPPGRRGGQSRGRSMRRGDSSQDCSFVGRPRHDLPAQILHRGVDVFSRTRSRGSNRPPLARWLGALRRSSRPIRGGARASRVGGCRSVDERRYPRSCGNPLRQAHDERNAQIV